ncbi:hypothetical protein [Natronorubrum sulfidifaciens]|uniref:Peptidase S1 and S6, chymotrypsin/Hap n=1 Tax=Natronorubrum sulfidifaciens JCM 14089 TaxID=1230460 RepID=L9W457_9EURY|nr:hypothetical protein [Natronorubrum sulfidifaciens]ELY44046.1 peptidase S1 and S6, chymotrypsin/Hap [Natronorubrum sulfidifaciens JCM 14089]
MRDDSTVRRSTIDRRSLLLTGGATLAGLGALSAATAASAQDDPEWPIGTPDEGDDSDEWDGDTVPDDPTYDQQQSVADDSGTIQCTVPSAWSDVDGTPLDIGPALRAAPDLEGYATSWDVPGIEIIATTDLGTDQEAVLDEFVDFGSECTDGGQWAFQSNGFVFLVQTWYQCGSGDTMFLAMVGAPVDESAPDTPDEDGPGTDIPDGNGPEDGMPGGGPENGRGDGMPGGGPENGHGDGMPGGGPENGHGDGMPGGGPENGHGGGPGSGMQRQEPPPLPADPPYLILFGGQVVTEPDWDAVGAAIASLEVRSPDDLTETV